MMLKTSTATILALGLALPVMAQTASPASNQGTPSPGAASGGSASPSFDPDPIQTDLGGMRASRIIGMAVYNDNQEKIGSVDDIVIGADRALHAIISVGGFLGFDGRLIEVAYQKLQFSTAKGATNRAVLPGATKQSLSTMRSFEYSRQG